MLMTIHKFLDDTKRLLIWAGIIFAGLFTFGTSQKRKGREELKAEINENALNNSREARKTDDKVSKMSDSTEYSGILVVLKVAPRGRGV